MYINELQARVYFQHERSLDRALEKRRLAHERKASTVERPHRHWRLLSRRR